MKTNLPQPSTLSSFGGNHDVCALRCRCKNASDTELKSEKYYDL